MSDAMFDDERDEALALLWLDDDGGATDVLAARAVEAWAAAPARPPAGLLDRVTVGARAARPPGLASGPPPPVYDPVATYRRTADDLAALLATLDDADWSAPVPGYGTVGATVAHLAGIEEICLGWLGAAGPPPEAVADHRQAARATMDALGPAPRSTVARIWYDRTLEVAEAAGGVPSTHAVLAHDIPTDRDGLLLLRSFEIWAHYDDIAGAVGRARLDVDAGRLLTMSRALADALPFTFAIRGDATPDARVRLVLIGRGGGTYDLTFGEPPGAAAATATIVLDAVGACRLAQGRLPLDELAVVVEGDDALAAAVLDHVDAFARD